MEPSKPRDVPLSRIAEWREQWPVKSFLKSISGAALNNLIKAGEIRTIPRNAVLIREGDSNSEIFLLLSACVKVTARTASGKQALLAVRIGGDIVGELSAVDGDARNATIVSCSREEGAAVVLSRADFEQALSEHPTALVELTASVSRKLRASTRRRVDFIDCPVEVRLARVLVELADDHGQRIRGQYVIGVNLTQLELGTLVGVAEPTAQRALRELRRQGLVITEGRRPAVPDLRALRTFTEGGAQPLI